VVIDEHIRADGELVRTHLEVADGGKVRIVADDVRGELSVAAVEKVMSRYGRPLDPDIPVTGDAIDLGAARLVRLRFKAAVDADARDWLVWAAPGAEPLAALATGVAAALRYLVMRLTEEREERDG
jgi:hypothetical protein